jgi:hypothetical protein
MLAAMVPDSLLLFTPVATAYRGANGWSGEVQRAFVAALARCGVVAAAARSVGRSPSSAYQLRRRAGEDSGFARAWDEAIARASDRALDLAMEGGMVARRSEVFYRGRPVGWRTRHDDRLALAALKALDKREARWAARDESATMLLSDALELLNQREMCEASPRPSVAESPAPTPFAARPDAAGPRLKTGTTAGFAQPVRATPPPRSTVAPGLTRGPASPPAAGGKAAGPRLRAGATGCSAQPVRPTTSPPATVAPGLTRGPASSSATGGKTPDPRLRPGVMKEPR